MTTANTPSRIEQSERLFTVRPRYVASSKRGEVCAFKLHIPDKDDTSGFTNKPGSVGEQKAFKALTREVSDTENGENLYIDFVVGALSYDIVERSEILQTFGSKEAVYFYGKAPVIVTIQGMLADDLDNDQYATFLNIYHKFLSGSEAAKEYCSVELLTSNSTFRGAFLSLSINQSAERDTDINFTAQLLAKDFSFKSTDSFFKNTSGDAIVTVPVVGRVDPYPTVSQKQVHASKMAEISKAAVTDSNGNISEYTKAPSPTFNVDSNAYTQGVNSPAQSDEINTNVFDDAANWISDFFNTDIILDVAAPALDILDKVTEYANSAIKMVDAIEGGIDGLLDDVITITETAWNTYENLKDVVTTVSNFPPNIEELVRSAVQKGKRSADEMATLGSGQITPDVAARLLASAGSPVGASRGTPQGNAALSIYKPKIKPRAAVIVPYVNPINPNEIPAITIGG